jgi:hypothetical protein
MEVPAAGVACGSAADSRPRNCLPDARLSTRHSSRYIRTPSNVPHGAAAVVCLEPSIRLQRSFLPPLSTLLRGRSPVTQTHSGSLSPYSAAWLEISYATKTRLRLPTRPPRQRLPSSLPYRKRPGTELPRVCQHFLPRRSRSRLTTRMRVKRRICCI